MQTPLPPPLVYKILRASEWDVLKSEGQFLGSADDLRDGFIHLSCASQVQGTLSKHFSGASDLVIVTVRTDGLPIVMERSRGNEYFPHLYGALPQSAVTNVGQEPPSDS